MEEDVYLHKLHLRGIKPTAMRLLILRAMLDTNRAVSQHDLEETLQTVDKSTIFRTVMLFMEHHLLAALKYPASAVRDGAFGAVSVA